MKRGDAVLVLAELDSDNDEGGAVTVNVYNHPYFGGYEQAIVPLEHVHALPNEATRRRAAELARQLSADGIARSLGRYLPALPLADWAVIDAALLLLAGNAAEDKPAAQSADAEGQGP